MNSVARLPKKEAEVLLNLFCLQLDSELTSESQLQFPFELAYFLLKPSTIAKGVSSEAQPVDGGLSDVEFVVGVDLGEEHHSRKGQSAVEVVEVAQAARDGVEQFEKSQITSKGSFGIGY